MSDVFHESHTFLSLDNSSSELGTLNEALQELLDGIQVSFVFVCFQYVVEISLVWPVFVNPLNL